MFLFELYVLTKLFLGTKKIWGEFSRMLPVATVLAPLSEQKFWGRTSSHNHRNHEWCERAGPEKGNAQL